MAEHQRLLMIVGAATPPGRLAAAIATAAEAARAHDGDTAPDILNLAETPVEICDGRPLEAYGEATRQAVARIASAAAVLIGAPVYRASFPGVLKNLLDITPVEALQGKPVGITGSTWLVTRLTAGRVRPPVGWGSVLGGGCIAERLVHRGRPSQIREEDYL